jgi:hypothetical protein
MSKDSTAEAINHVFGGASRCSWYGDITDALFCGLNTIAKSIQGQEDNGCTNRQASLCQSLDGIADAINNLSDAIREAKRQGD